MSTVNLEKNKAIVQRWIDEVFNQKKMDSISKLKVSSYLDWTPFPGQQLDLPVSGLKKSLPEFLGSLPDFNFSADDMFAEGDFVVCLGRWNATHQKEFMGIAPNCKQMGGTRIDIFRVTGEKMVEHWGCGHEVAFMELLGKLVPLPQQDHPTNDVRTIACQFLEEVWNQRNLAAIERFLDPFAIDHSNQALTMFLVLSAFPDAQINIEDIVAEGDKVTVISTFKGTHLHEFMGIPPTGRRVTDNSIHIFRIVNEKIVETWHDWDKSELLQQISA